MGRASASASAERRRARRAVPRLGGEAARGAGAVGRPATAAAGQAVDGRNRAAPIRGGGRRRKPRVSAQVTPSA